MQGLERNLPKSKPSTEKKKSKQNLEGFMVH